LRPYAGVENKMARGAKKIEELIASEHSSWVALRARSEGVSDA
jgi:hypothetical protein